MMWIHRTAALSLLLTLVGTDVQAADHLLAMRKPAHAAKPRGPAKQIYELSQREDSSDCLKASGVAAYVVSANGTNRGFLLRSVDRGFAANIGMQQGDVLLSINNRVIQTGSDADRVLTSTTAGAGRVTFVHPSDAGLQLYNNVQVNIPNFAAPADTHSHWKSNDDKGASSTTAVSNQPRNESAAIAASEQYMLELINSDRQKNGSSPVQLNSSLSSLARGHAQDMAARGFFNHVNPDGVDPQGRAAQAGIRAGVYENIAYQNVGASMQRCMALCEASFMNEPPNQQNHRGNILDPNQVAVGVGVARGKDGRVIAVQEFSHSAP